ncbi:MAG: hypothetical protein GX446_06990 [Chthonomonadales bacterium]|nr:hypothetical protein [Chthonomonadales bacterium]
MSGSQSAADSAVRTAIERVDFSIAPDTLDCLLQPEPAESPLERLRPLWHEAPAFPRFTVSVTSSDERTRLVTLSVACDHRDWRPDIMKWSLPTRMVPELLGGDAVAAQDALLEDDTVLQLLLLPGETREASLEVRATLDGSTPAGDYAFDVVVHDAHDASQSRIAGMLRLRHPVSGYETHLPAIYADEMNNAETRDPDDHSGPFFRRYLKGFEDSTVPLRRRLDHLHRFFDAYEAPPDFLPWLATWVGIVLDENWPEMKRRRLIREAVELYRWRGTRRGLARYLEIYAGVRPEINDRPFRGMRLGPNTRLGVGLSDPERMDQNTVLGDVPNHSFVVTLAVADPSTVNEQTVRDIIEAQKPAHTAYVARIVRRSSEATE